MKQSLLIIFVLFFVSGVFSQDLSSGLVVNDKANHAMQALTKPGYLSTYTARWWVNKYG